MSNKLLNWAWNQNLPRLTKLVLLRLADHADDQGVCWPSIRYIAESCSVVPRTVQRKIDWLKRNGYVVVEARYTEGGKQTSNQYRLITTQKRVKSGLPDGQTEQTPSGNVSDIDDASVIDPVQEQSPSTPDTAVVQTPTEPQPEPPLPASGGDDFEWPDKLALGVWKSARRIISDCPGTLAQSVIDEWAGAIGDGAIKSSSPLPYLRGLIQKAREGTFTTDRGHVVLEARTRRRRNEEAVRRAAQVVPGRKKKPEYNHRRSAVDSADNYEAMINKLRKAANGKKTG